jgi:hypothetical protein
MQCPKSSHISYCCSYNCKSPEVPTIGACRDSRQPAFTVYPKQNCIWPEEDNGWEATRKLFCSADNLILAVRTLVSHVTDWPAQMRAYFGVITTTSCNLGPRSRDSSVSTATGYVLDGQDSIPGRSKRFFSTTVPRPALGSTQPPIQWVPGSLSPGQSGRGVKLTTHLHLEPGSRMTELYFHSPTRLHGVVLS